MCILNLGKCYRWSYLQSKNRDTDRENKPMDTKGIESGMNWEIRTDMYTLLGIKQVIKENLFHSTRGLSTQCSVMI